MMGLVEVAVRIGKALTRSKIGRALLFALVAVLTIGGVYQFGRQAGVSAERSAQADRMAKASKIADEVRAKAGVITQDIRRDVAVKTVEIRWRTKTLKEEVPIYVPFEVDRTFSVPVGFVRMHDAAALGSTLPRSPGGPVEAPSGVALYTVADTVVDNYGACHVLEVEALAWREWYSRQAALYGAHIKGVSAEPQGSALKP
ncbi:hypothetical protein OVA11_18955 [Caulobacter sp. SL161]|uniref:hypothetical protein n=1 Tax=Caulobacter sp. SL161 TaxID=2995156 RepID=UPI002273325D|nr:hypothetical protein [Caulobacter sp. SL161]MCY1649057.1 hypothetical protein [Caulobacter sp. SL161]